MSASRILIDIIKHFNSSLNMEKHTIPLYSFLEERISKMMFLIRKNMDNKEKEGQNPQRLTANSDSLKVIKIFYFNLKNLKYLCEIPNLYIYALNYLDTSNTNLVKDYLKMSIECIIKLIKDAVNN